MSCRLSLCIIAKNEEAQISRCITSARDFVDEIVVVDTGSTDNTVSLARSLGAKIRETDWQDDFSQARNESLDQAGGDWILFLDCDETVTPDTGHCLKKVIQDEKYDGYWLRCTNIFNHQPGTTFAAFRLFRNNPLFRFECPIHEQILPSILRHSAVERIGRAPVMIYHYGYENNQIMTRKKTARNLLLLHKAYPEYGSTGFLNFYLGVEYQKLGHYQKALDYYRLAMVKSTLAQSYTPAMIRSMGYCYLNLGHYQEGLALINEQLKHFPDYTDLVYLKGLLYAALNNYTQALTCMDHCLAMGPPPENYFSVSGIGDAKPQNFINKLMAGLLDHSRELLHQGHRDQAFTILNTVFNQLKKAPAENLYTRLIQVMVELTKSI